MTKPRKVPISLLSPLDQLRREAKELCINGAEQLDQKELCRQIALEKIRRGD